MRTITAILNNLTDFNLPAAVVQTRLEALQPVADERDRLNLGYFLAR